MRILLTNFGSLGDVLPLLALAVRLRADGHDARMGTSEAYRRRVEGASVPFTPLRPDVPDLGRRAGLSAEAMLRRLMRDNGFLFREAMLPQVRPSFADSLPALAGVDLLLAGAYAYGPRLAAEVRGTPVLTLHIEPLMLLPGPPDQRARSVGAGEAWAGPVHALRRELELPPAPDPVFTGPLSQAVGVLGLFSPIFASASWPGLRRTGFIYSDGLPEGGEARLSPELDRWLDAGPPPVVVAFGSTGALLGAESARAVVSVCRALGRRVVVLGLERLAVHPGPDLFLGRGDEPYGPLFPRAAVVAHHAGVGTAAQALRAGAPQLSFPFFVFQPDTAARLRRLGVSETVAPAELSVARVQAALVRLLEDAAPRAAAARAQAALALEDGPGAAVRAVEDLLTRSGQPS